MDEHAREFYATTRIDEVFDFPEDRLDDSGLTERQFLVYTLARQHHDETFESVNMRVGEEGTTEGHAPPETRNQDGVHPEYFFAVLKRYAEYKPDSGVEVPEEYLG
jgi:hypothetical protein